MTLTRQTEVAVALVEDIEMGKDGSHERCCVCRNEHRRKDPLMKCDYCPRVVHQKQCAGIRRNHKVPFQCPACKEKGTIRWRKKHWKKPKITIEEWLSTAPPEICEKPIINTLNNKDKSVSSTVMDEVLRAPIWQISEARIHKAREAQTPQKAIKWIQEVMKGGSTV